MNCYLRWLKKTGEFCFATQLFTTVLKSKLSDIRSTFPQPLEKTQGSQMTTKLPDRIHTFRGIEHCTRRSISFKSNDVHTIQTSYCQRYHRPLNKLFTSQKAPLCDNWAKIELNFSCLLPSCWYFDQFFEGDMEVELLHKIWKAFNSFLLKTQYLFPCRPSFELPWGSSAPAEKHFVR